MYDIKFFKFHVMIKTRNTRKPNLAHFVKKNIQR